MCFLCVSSVEVCITPPLLQGVPQLALCLSEETEHHIRAATAWSIGQMGRHTSEHAKAVATSNVLHRLLELYMDTSSSEDLKDKVRAAAALQDGAAHAQHSLT